MDFDDGYDSDKTLYYPDIEIPDVRIIELSNALIYINVSLNKEDLLNYVRNRIYELNVYIYNTQDLNAREDLEILKEIYFYLLYYY